MVCNRVAFLEPENRLALEHCHHLSFGAPLFSLTDRADVRPISKVNFHKFKFRFRQRELLSMQRRLWTLATLATCCGLSPGTPMAARGSHGPEYGAERLGKDRQQNVRVAGRGWKDLSDGQGRCQTRVLKPSSSNQSRPYHGAVCEVRWTAWLAEERLGVWYRGERVGMVQPNATLEFTLGGGAKEATRAWDLAVATMTPGEVVEIFAMHDYAFGEGAEPHVPANASIFFEVALDNWTDFASGHEIVYGLSRIENDVEEDALRRELDRAAVQDTGPSLLQDLGGLSSGPSTQPNYIGRLTDAPPVPLQGQGQGYEWSENPDELFLRVHVDDSIRPSDVRISITPLSLSICVGDQPLLKGDLEGRVKPDECTWAISDEDNTLDVYLTKQRRMHNPDGTDHDGDSCQARTSTQSSLADIWATIFRKRHFPPHEASQS